MVRSNKMVDRLMLKFTMALLVVIPMLLYIGNVKAYNAYTYIPNNAKLYLPVVNDTSIKFFPEFPNNHRNYFAGLIEQESCVSLTSKMCWNPRSELKTSREVGIGLSQITKAFNRDGSIRFDSLEAMAKNHQSELKELSWKTIAQRPDLQIRTIILMTKDNDKELREIKDPIERIKFDDSAYNKGVRGVHNARRICGLKHNCNPQLWFGNVDQINTTGNKPLYGNQTAFMINTTHVSNVFKIRMNKYKPYFN